LYSARGGGGAGAFSVQFTRQDKDKANYKKTKSQRQGENKDEDNATQHTKKRITRQDRTRRDEAEIRLPGKNKSITKPSTTDYPKTITR
jgi:hypothetical protein